MNQDLDRLELGIPRINKKKLFQLVDWNNFNLKLAEFNPKNKEEWNELKKECWYGEDDCEEKEFIEACEDKNGCFSWDNYRRFQTKFTHLQIDVIYQNIELVKEFCEEELDFLDYKFRTRLALQMLEEAEENEEANKVTENEKEEDRYVIPENRELKYLTPDTFEKIIKGSKYFDEHPENKILLKLTFIDTQGTKFFKHLWDKSYCESEDIDCVNGFGFPENYPQIFTHIQNIQKNGWSWFITNCTKLK